MCLIDLFSWQSLKAEGCLVPAVVVQRSVLYMSRVIHQLCMMRPGYTTSQTKLKHFWGCMLGFHCTSLGLYSTCVFPIQINWATYTECEWIIHASSSFNACIESLISFEIESLFFMRACLLQSMSLEVDFINIIYIHYAEFVLTGWQCKCINTILSMVHGYQVK